MGCFRVLVGDRHQSRSWRSTFLEGFYLQPKWNTPLLVDKELLKAMMGWLGVHDYVFRDTDVQEHGW